MMMNHWSLAFRQNGIFRYFWGMPASDATAMLSLLGKTIWKIGRVSYEFTTLAWSENVEECRMPSGVSQGSFPGGAAAIESCWGIRRAQAVETQT